MPTNFMNNLHFFEGPSEDTDGNRLNSKQLEAQQKFTTMANAAYAYAKQFGIPEGYEASVALYKEVARTNDAPINYEALYALDQTVTRTIYNTDVFGKLGIPQQMVEKFSKNMEIKQYLLTSENWPNFTKTYRSPTFIQLSQNFESTNGIGMQLGISIDHFTQLASEGALWSVEAMLLQELGAKFGLFKSMRGLLGTGCQYAMMDDGSDASLAKVTGIANYASAQFTKVGVGNDGDLTSATDQDVNAMIRQLFVKLKKCYQPGKFVLVTTSGVASEMFYHRDTYQVRLDSERVKQMLEIIAPYQRDGSGFEWWVTDQLYNAAPSATHQRAVLMKVGPGLINDKVFLPTQMLPIAAKMYEGDLVENCIYANAIQVKKVNTTYNAVPIAIATTGTETIAGVDLITTDTGFIPDGTRIYPNYPADFKM